MGNASDTKKLIELGIEYSKNVQKEFTTDLLFGYIRENNIKFKKTMGKKRIGYLLAKSGLFDYSKDKYKVTYYIPKKEIME